MPARKVEFMGWTDSIPSRAERKEQLDEHDILRIVLLAENAKEMRWVEFRCEDEMHATKAVAKLKTFGFKIDIVARGDRIYARRWW